MSEEKRPIILIPEDREPNINTPSSGEVQFAEKGNTEKLLEQIDGKLDILIASEETEE